jgi:hypothetical protein
MLTTVTVDCEMRGGESLHGSGPEIIHTGLKSFHPYCGGFPRPRRVLPNTISGKNLQIHQASFTSSVGGLSATRDDVTHFVVHIKEI